MEKEESDKIEELDQPRLKESTMFPFKIEEDGEIKIMVREIEGKYMDFGEPIDSEDRDHSIFHSAIRSLM